jgi:hypothetical protein
MKKFTYPPELDEACLAAYRSMLDAQVCSADDILADPDLRRDYVDRVQWSFAAGEERILRNLMRLRKAKKLPRSRPAKEAGDA